MLQSLPSVLADLERRLIAGEDPLPLLGNVRWPELVDWPRSREEALRLRQRLAGLNALIQGLQAPLRATLMGLSQDASYQRKGEIPLPGAISMRFHKSV
nr:hypothetical protein [uncultured Holophaga sp.]